MDRSSYIIIIKQVQSNRRNQKMGNIFTTNVIANNDDTNSIDSHMDFDMMIKDDIVKYLKKKEIFKLDILNEDYTNIVNNLNIESENLLAIEMEVFDKLSQQLDRFDYTKAKSLGMKTKFKKAVQPQFKQSDVVHADANQDQNPISFNLDIPLPTKAYNNSPISLAEFVDSFKTDNYAHDMFGISKKILKDLSQLTKYKLINKFNEILNGDDDVDDISLGKVNYIYKGKNLPLDEIKSFRMVTSMPNVINHFHRILALRLSDYFAANSYLDTTIQKGGISGLTHPLLEQIVKVKSVLFNANQYNREACIMFLDISNAFPSVNINKLCDVMRKYHIHDNVIDYIKNFYESFEYFVDTKEWKSDLKQWNQGLIQGCPMSALLFVMVINYILEHIGRKHNNAGYNLYGKPILFTAYIDDITIIANNPTDMMTVYNDIVSCFAEFGLQINVNKTAYMHINSANPNTIPNTNGIQKVEKYKYLGEVIDSNSKPQTGYMRLYYYVRNYLKWMESKIDDMTRRGDIIKNKLIPIVQRRFTAMYELDGESKMKILRIITYQAQQWGLTLDVEVNVSVDLKSVFANTTDKVLQSINFDDIANVSVDIEDKEESVNLNQIVFSYDNVDLDDANDNDVDIEF